MFRTLVSTDALAAHLDDPSWVVVDTRYNLRDANAGLASYREGHIAGAGYASLSHDLAGPLSGVGGRHPLPSPEAMATTFGHLGIGPGVQVTCYDGDNLFAARLWWMLRYMGHDEVAVLDGGYAKWTREGRPTRPSEESRPAATFLGAPREHMRLSLEAVQQGTRDGSLSMVDARTPERFEGQGETIDRVGGHIPGATNHFFKQNFSGDGIMLQPDALRATLGPAVSGAPMNQVGMYCGSGVTACQNLLALEYAGLPGAKLYVGSWSEWSADEQRPIETGPVKTR